MELNKQQEEAFSLIKEWYTNPDSKQLFLLTGFAGTGKTTTIVETVKRLGLDINNDVAFLTPTGKSAEVLISKGIPATTIHRVIYTVAEVKKEEKDSDGKVTKRKRIEFFRKDELDKNYKLLILDEFSMVSDKLYKDVAHFNIKILATGDGGQLPAIGGGNIYFDKPDFTLNEIVRQNADNPIIQLATDIRFNKPIIPENYNPNVIEFYRRAELTDEKLKEIYLNSDQIICGLNSTKFEIDRKYRSFLGYSEKDTPKKGEKVIALSNNWTRFVDKDLNFNLVNGTIGVLAEDATIEKESEKIGSLRIIPNYACNPSLKRFYFDMSGFEGNDFIYDISDTCFIFESGDIALNHFSPKKSDESPGEYRERVKKYVLNKRYAIAEERINRFQFAYGITCHKSQGSEWDTVVIYDESKVFTSDRLKWLYTAVTRAKKKVILII